MREEGTITSDPPTDTPALMGHLASRAARHLAYISSKIPPDMSRFASPDDILQDAWTKMFKNIKRVCLSEPEAFDRWAYTEINRTIIDTCRRLRRLKRGGAHNVFLENDRRAESFNKLLNCVASGQKTPSGVVSSKEAIRALRLALASLPEERQQAVIRCHLEGQSQDEAAVAMNKTPAAVNSLVYHGIQDLRECLGSASRFFSDAR
jgi:RNA polymerase sigma factor (sigma-70 family)